MTSEELLPPEILNKAQKSGNEFSWYFEDARAVAAAALSKNMAILGGQVQYITESGTCELYWLKADPDSKKETENWSDYVKRSCAEFTELFNKNIEVKNVKEDAISNFEHLKEMTQQGIDVDAFRRLVIYPITEDEYKKLKQGKIT